MALERQFSTPNSLSPTLSHQPMAKRRVTFRFSQSIFFSLP